MRFWIRLFYLLRLRWLVNVVQRLVKGEPWLPRAELATFETPQDVADFVRDHFEWRADGMRLGSLFIPLDYYSRPAVTQHKLNELGGVDGDCDDCHWWVAHVLSDVPGVAWAHPFSVVWTKGGHTTCLYEYRGIVYLFNYGIAAKLDGPTVEAISRAAAHLVLQWHNDNLEEGEEPAALKFWVRETTRNKLVACGVD